MLHDAQLFTDDFTFFFLHIILSKYNTLFILVENQFFGPRLITSRS